MILTFLLSGSYLTMKMAHGLGWNFWSCHLSQGKRVGYMTVVVRWGGAGRRRGDGVAGSRGSQESSRPLAELDEQEGEGLAGWRVVRGLIRDQTTGVQRSQSVVS